MSSWPAIHRPTAPPPANDTQFADTAFKVSTSGTIPFTISRSMSLTSIRRASTCWSALTTCASGVSSCPIPRRRCLFSAVRRINRRCRKVRRLPALDKRCPAPANLLRICPRSHRKRSSRPNFPPPEPVQKEHIDGCAGVAFRLTAGGTPTDVKLIAERPTGYGIGNFAVHEIAATQFLPPGGSADQLYYEAHRYRPTQASQSPAELALQLERRLWTVRREENAPGKTWRRFTLTCIETILCAWPHPKARPSLQAMRSPACGLVPRASARCNRSGVRTWRWSRAAPDRGRSRHAAPD